MEPEIRFCKSADGTRIAYVTYGDHPGTPLVLSNSWPSDLMAMWASYPEHRAFISHLTRGRRLVCMDGRGVGSSEREIDDVSMAASVADLAAVVHHLRLEQFDMLGAYDGAAVSIAYAAQHPEQVSRLLL